MNCYHINMIHKHNELRVEEWALKALSVFSAIFLGLRHLSSAWLHVAFTPKRFWLKYMTRPRRDTSMQQYRLPHDVYAHLWYQQLTRCELFSQPSWRRHARSSSKSGRVKVSRGLLGNLTAWKWHLAFNISVVNERWGELAKPFK